MTTMPRHHELPFGAEPVAGGVRFRVWAPRAKAVALRLDGDNGGDLPMRREGNGWFSLLSADARPGDRYRYVVDGQAFPDPASRCQPDGVHGASEIIDGRAHDWCDAGWRGRRWEEIVLYELHPGTFSASGDFAGVIARLDHLCTLGITAIELMPVAAFPGARNWGYDGAYLYAPCAAYGRPEDLKRLVEACHARGLAVFLDVVYNHFGPEGNYLAAIAPDFFTERHHTPWGAALDYAGPLSRPVRDFMIENALYWLVEYHFDGLRLDAVHAIIDETSPDIIDEIAAKVRAGIGDRAVHLVLENDRNEARRLARVGDCAAGYTAQWNDDLHHALHVLACGETSGYYVDFAEHPGRRLGRALAEGFVYQGEPSGYRGGACRGEPSSSLPPSAFIGYLQNHDQVGNNAFGLRLAARIAEKMLHAAVVTVLLSPQIPLLFMGEEWASERPFLFFCDFEPGLAEAVREGRRREFAHFPEFRDPHARERIPDPTALGTFTASRLDWAELAAPAHARWLDRYRRLIDIRAREIAPRLPGMTGFAGSFRALAERAVEVEWRLGDGSRLRLLANFGEAPVPAPPGAAGGRVLYASAAPPDSSIDAQSATYFLTPAGSG